MKNKQLSALYIDSSGALMLGEPNLVESMVAGIFKIPFDDMCFLSETGILCRGYFSDCKKKYRYF